MAHIKAKLFIRHLTAFYVLCATHNVKNGRRPNVFNTLKSIKVLLTKHSKCQRFSYKGNMTLKFPLSRLNPRVGNIYKCIIFVSGMPTFFLFSHMKIRKKIHVARKVTTYRNQVLQSSNQTVSEYTYQE